MRNKIKFNLAVVLSAMTLLNELPVLAMNAGEQHDSGYLSRGMGLSHFFTPCFWTGLVNKQLISEEWKVKDEDLRDYFAQMFEDVNQDFSIRLFGKTGELPSFSQLPLSKNVENIHKDIVRANLPGVDKAILKKNSESVNIVLQRVHTLTGAEFDHGNAVVCAGIYVMLQLWLEDNWEKNLKFKVKSELINECVEKLKDAFIKRMCSKIYGELLPIMSIYAERKDDLTKDPNDPSCCPVIKRCYETLCDRKTYTPNKIKFALLSVGPSVLCAWGLYERKNSNFAYDSPGPSLLKKLLLYNIGKIKQEELEDSMTEVLVEQCEQFLSSADIIL